MSQDNNYSQGPVPLAARKGVIPLTFVMLGLTFFSASMWTGGTLGTGLTYHDFFLAVLFGNLLLGIYTAFLGYIGAKTGLSTHLLARYSFGVKGSWLPSLLLGGTQVGWFGVGVAMFAIPVSKATGIDANILIAVSGLLMTLTIFFGISALTILSIIAVPAIVILGSYSVWLAVSGVGGLEHLKTIVPQTPLDFSSALALAHRDGMGSRVTASHTTAMHSYNGAYASRLFRLLKMSGINFVANPLVNIHLQGRFDTYPKRRGVTRVKEMLEAGINVCFGHDDVFDPWYPLGTANMLQVLHMGLHVCQLMGYGQINDGLNLITTHSAKTLHLQDYSLSVGNAANLVILPAENGFDAVRRQTPARYSIRHGRVIAETVPSQTTLHLPQPEAVTFKR